MADLYAAVVRMHERGVNCGDLVGNRSLCDELAKETTEVARRMIDPNFERNGDRVKVFRDGTGEWRWQRKAANGEIVSVSGEGYQNKEHAINMAEQLNPGRTLLIEGE